MARPRSEEAHQAALDATVELLLESGVEGLTLEEVAARSGVAKSTLYRHFGTKEQLIASAARRCVIQHPTPDSGDLAEDLHFLFERYTQAEEEQRVPDLLPMLLDAAGRDPALHAVLTDLLTEKRRPIRTVLQLAQLRGEISPTLDLDVAMAMIIGPFVHRRTVDKKPVTPEFTEVVLRGAIAALRATADAGTAAPA
jgi:AcrR family transcriptional regulator